MTSVSVAEEVFKHLDKSVEFVKNTTCLLVRAGSHSYGTNVSSSDIDLKGVCFGQKRHYLGSNVFEQAEIKKPDTTIFEMRKFVNLAMAANPNVIEALFVDPSDQILVSPIGEKLIEHRDKFLSKRVKHTLCGYARSQVSRMKRHREWLLHAVNSYPTRTELGLPERTLIPSDQMQACQSEINKELERYSFDWMDELSEPMKIKVHNAMSEMLAELKITTEDMWLSAARKIGMSDNFIELMQRERAYTNKKREYEQYQEWKCNRNPKRAADEAKWGFDRKHAYHLIRLTRMAREVLTTWKLLVRRSDAKELVAIRNGAWSFDEIVEFAESEDKALQSVYESCTILPKTPDFAFLEALCIELVEQALYGQ